jgi:hypothetical protein
LLAPRNLYGHARDVLVPIVTTLVAKLTNIDQ